MTEDKKNITRKIVVFQKSGKFFQVHIAMQGYIFEPEDKTCPTMQEILYIGTFKKRYIKLMVGLFSKAFYNIEIRES
jgi:hypothetical protein